MIYISYRAISLHYQPKVNNETWLLQMRCCLCNIYIYITLGCAICPANFIYVSCSIIYIVHTLLCIYI